MPLLKIAQRLMGSSNLTGTVLHDMLNGDKIESVTLSWLDYIANGSVVARPGRLRFHPGPRPPSSTALGDIAGVAGLATAVAV